MRGSTHTHSDAIVAPLEAPPRPAPDKPRIRRLPGRIGREMQYRIWSRLRRRSKQEEELAYWRPPVRKEGGLSNANYEHAWTDHFGLEREFFAGSGFWS